AQPPEEVQRDHHFSPKIQDNQRAAGVQNTKQGERLQLTRLESFAGAWLQATGEYTDAGGQVRRVAVSIGPEQGTVGPHAAGQGRRQGGGPGPGVRSTAGVRLCL
ncbi:MAG: hypothetical protein ACYC5M_12630, partial [Anaerolineae bacterium]